MSASVNYPVTLDYTKEPRRLMQDLLTAGKYPWRISEKSVPIPPVREVITINLMLVHFDRLTSIEEVHAEIERLSCRPANLAEGLAFGGTYPEEQMKCPIVVLGAAATDTTGHSCVHVLFHDMEGRRDVSLYWRRDNWSEEFRFLVVHAPG